MADGSGLRYADPVIRFEKHAIFGKNEATKKAYTRPWGSQPMKVDLKTGRLSGTPHPDQKPLKFPEDKEAPAAQEAPHHEVQVKVAYGR